MSLLFLKEMIGKKYGRPQERYIWGSAVVRGRNLFKNCIKFMDLIILSFYSSQEPPKHDDEILCFPKKIPIEMHNMLHLYHTLSKIIFFSWWSSAQQSNDFQFENNHKIIPIYIHIIIPLIFQIGKFLKNLCRLPR